MSKHLITSALPYINGIKHLGNLVGSLLPADVYARFLRLEGEEVLFICATDEHGTPAELSAREANLSVQAYCDSMYLKQASVFERFGLSFDHFGRTSSVQNHELTKRIYQSLEDNGYIAERQIKQVYALDDGRFLPDRYIVGTCPNCGYEAARGDQCENCTSLLDPVELFNPRSAVSGSAALEIRATRHLFLQLDTLSDTVRKWVDVHSGWSRLTRSIAYKWLDEGLNERCITRDLEWGISVPREGFEGKVFYVWFDAPVGYIAATREWAEQAPALRNWKDWWLGASDVKYTQFMGKDNVPFHAVFFPAMLLGTGDKWTTADEIKSCHWLTYYGGKFSTSQKRGIFLDDALEAFDADVWRYFLLAHAPETDDTSFTWELFASTVNKDLVGTYGNFVNRTLKLAVAQFGSSIPGGGEPTSAEHELLSNCEMVVSTYRTHLRTLHFRKAIQALRELWTLGNVYLDRRAPWNLVKTNPEEAAMVLRTAINLMKVFTMAAEPIIPFSAVKVYDALRIGEQERREWLTGGLTLDSIEAGRRFSVPDPLFRRVDKTEIERLRTRFAGA